MYYHLMQLCSQTFPNIIQTRLITCFSLIKIIFYWIKFTPKVKKKLKNWSTSSSCPWKWTFVDCCHRPFVVYLFFFFFFPFSFSFSRFSFFVAQTIDAQGLKHPGVGILDIIFSKIISRGPWWCLKFHMGLLV